MTENTAKQSLRESLSALVDDQATELELHRILKQSDDEVRSVWARYQLVSTALKGDTPSGEYVDLSARIRDAVAAEDSHAVMAEPDISADLPKTKRWWQQAGRFAIAASVAGAVVIGAQQSALLVGDAGDTAAGEVVDRGSTQDQIPILNPSAYSVSTDSVSTDGGQNRVNTKIFFTPKRLDQTVPGEVVQKRLNYLMLEHAEHAAQNSGRGILPLARIPRIEEE